MVNCRAVPSPSCCPLGHSLRTRPASQSSELQKINLTKRASSPHAPPSSPCWGEHGNSGMRKKACVGHENPVRHRVHCQSVSAVVGVYLIQHSIIVRIVLPDHRHVSGSSGRVNSMNTLVECDRVRPAADLQRCNDSMPLQVKNHQFGISATARKEPSLFGINRHARWPYARRKGPLPYYRPLANIDCSYFVGVF